MEDNPDEIEDIPADHLYLDDRNPRLAWRVDAGEVDQEGLLKVLWEQMAVDELVLSIAQNGYFRSEPLFVVPRGDQGEFTVVEGNRRLAAVRIIRDEDVREELNIGGEMEEMISDSDVNLDTVPCIKYNSREDLWETVGFRHINGIQKWDSYSKAEYIVDVHDEYDKSLEEIASKIGDTHSTVKRLYSGYKIMQQAEEEGIFSRQDTYKSSLYFSHLYTAADQNGYRKFLGIDGNDLRTDEPVDDEKIDRLEELLKWLYGSQSENIPPVIQSQNPDLKRLRHVIQDDEALTTLRQTGSLDEAHDTALGEEKLFRENLIEAKRSLKEAMGNVASGYEGNEEMFDVIRSIANVTNSLYSAMKEKRISRSDKQSGPVETDI